MNVVEQAEHVLNNLRAKRDALVAHGIELGGERAKLAFAAHAAGDAKAKKRLDEINRESALHDSELRSLDAAISEATARVAAAQAAEAREAERQTATELRSAIARLREAAAAADTGLAQFIAAGDLMRTALDQIHDAGAAHPNHQQLLTMGERAIRTAIAKTVWARCVERLPPNERISFAHSVDEWSKMLTRRLDALQNEKAA
jgi:hypothetical protein